jgi:hypothetical protein
LSTLLEGWTRGLGVPLVGCNAAKKYLGKIIAIESLQQIAP